MLTAHLEIDRPPVDSFAGFAGIDIEAAERAAAALLVAFGVPDGGEAAVRIPARMAAGLAELLNSPVWTLTTFPNRENQHELVPARDVSFTSVYAHEWRHAERASACRDGSARRSGASLARPIGRLLNFHNKDQEHR